jgi:hypothetical protein
MPTWTNPRTWATNDVVTASLLNTHLRDNLNFLYTKDHASVYQTANTAITTSTWTVVAFDAEYLDNNTMHDNVTNNSRVKCNSDGLYLIIFKAAFANDTTGVRRVMIRKNAAGASGGGTDLGTWTEDGIPAENTIVPGGRLESLTSADYIEMFVWQDTGGNLNLNSGSRVTYLQLMQQSG